jgi:hypothetical protein
VGFGWFFYSGLIDEVILDCYRLAKYYSRDPDDFLSKPLSAIQRHMKWTSKLIEIQNPTEDDQ